MEVVKVVLLEVVTLFLLGEHLLRVIKLVRISVLKK